MNRISFFFSKIFFITALSKNYKFDFIDLWIEYRFLLDKLSEQDYSTLDERLFFECVVSYVKSRNKSIDDLKHILLFLRSIIGAENLSVFDDKSAMKEYIPELESIINRAYFGKDDITEDEFDNFKINSDGDSLIYYTLRYLNYNVPKIGSFSTYPISAFKNILSLALSKLSSKLDIKRA